eukprot:gb/GFBE01035435.1/.p1 GENE.gb/GFBE01035435.1/~~gb/GFBE01035435.1/.p1  ORF type:complete len:312 (+),score=57.57 gb/GFBE01035435.1/:1-936(+)
MGAMLGVLGQCAYGALMLVNMLWAAAGMKILTLLPLAKKTSQGLCLTLTQISWSIALWCAPWMRCTEDPDTASEWKNIQKKMAEVDAQVAAGKGARRPLMVLGNHTSFFDTVLSVTTFPNSVLTRCRTYMDHNLFKLPILSTFCHCIGHFPVYFMSTEDGVFKVDKEKNAQVDQRVDEHLNSGGWLCFFPEGQVNKNPDTILPFRFGGMKKALDYDACLVSFVSYGNTSVWPKKAQMGGLPGKVRYSLKPVAPDGVKAYIKSLREQNLSEEEQKMEDHVLLAKYAHKLMQEQYDGLKEACGGGAPKNKKSD